MRHSLLTLRALATLTLSTASALPRHVDQAILAKQTFSCSGEQSLSLCCSGSLPANGAVQNCEESMHFMIGPTRLSANDYSRQLHSTTVNQCSSGQLERGLNRPVCCKAGFKPAAGASDYNGMNCVRGAVDGGSRWSFTPKEYSSKSYGNARRDVGLRFPKTSPLSTAVETIPVADDEARIFALSPEPEFPEHLEGSPSSSLTHSSAEHDSLQSELDSPIARKALGKRSRQTFTDAEPSGSGHQTQDAVLKDLLTSTSLLQRESHANALDGVRLAIEGSTALRRRNPRIATADTAAHAS